jgi:DNA polymerase
VTDPREELATLTAALRGYVERCQVTGASGLPRATAQDAAARLAPEDAPDRRAGEPKPAAPRQSGEQASVPGPPDALVAAQPPFARESEGSQVEGHARLRVLSSEVAACTRCSLHAGRTQTVFARGTGSSGLCFVGEGPGADEDAQGLPFVGKAGQLLDKMIDAMGLGRDEVYVCNIVKCRPPQNRKPEADEMSACRPYLMEQLELVDPKVIVALGATAVEGLLGLTGGITRLRGTWRLYRGRVAVMPTFHPAYLLRNPAAKREVWSDLQLVMTQLGRPLPGK